MRNKLLSSAAAIAVCFGVAAAYAQSPGHMGRESGQAAQPGGQSGRAAGHGANAGRGAEMGAAGRARETTGQASPSPTPNASRAERGNAQPSRASEQRPSTNGSATRDESQGGAKRSEQGAASRAQGTTNRATNNRNATEQNRGASARGESSRRGASNASSNPNASRSATGTSRANRSMQRGPSAASNSSRNGSAASRATTGSAGSADVSARGAATLDPQRQTRVSEAISRSGHVNRLGRADFSLSVGVAVPRHVRLAPLPEAIVAFAPEYRGYDYVVVNDEIVIVQPRSHRIVSVISERGGSARASSRERLRFSQDQRETIRRDVIRERSTVGSAPRDVEVRVGTVLPPDATLLSFPEDIDIPDLRPYRYVVIDDQVLVVDPADREIVEVIE